MSDDFDGCSSNACRPRNRPWQHTYEWGLCAHVPESARPEPRVGVLRARTMADGERSIVVESCTVTEMADRVEATLRTVPARLGPNALAILERGGTVGMSGGEYAAMALAVAQMLATDTEEVDGD